MLNDRDAKRTFRDMIDIEKMGYLCDGNMVHKTSAYAMLKLALVAKIIDAFDFRKGVLDAINWGRDDKGTDKGTDKTQSDDGKGADGVETYHDALYKYVFTNCTLDDYDMFGRKYKGGVAGCPHFYFDDANRPGGCGVDYRRCDMCWSRPYLGEQINRDSIEENRKVK